VTIARALRAGLAAIACAGISGCALLPVAAFNLAAQGAAAVAIAPIATMQEHAEKDPCLAPAGKGVTVTESLETAIPTAEGSVGKFEPVYWRPEFAGEGYPQVERGRTLVEGTLALTGRSVRLLAPAGAASIRIPYELVMDVEIQRSSDTGDPRSMIVKSCFGRFDVFTFVHQQPARVDPEATMAAAAQLKARVAAFRASAGN